MYVLCSRSINGDQPIPRSRNKNFMFKCSPKWDLQKLFDHASNRTSYPLNAQEATTSWHLKTARTAR